jgi:hypothetical protein
MFSLFKKKKEPVFYYSEYPPKERIDSFISQFLKPTFDNNGFVFKKSDFTFYKEMDVFGQAVTFKRSVYNVKGKTIRFDIQFSIFDEGYKKWHKSFYGIEAESKQLFGRSAGHIKNWDKEFMDNVWYDLAAVDNEQLTHKINNNIEAVGLTTLNELSNRTKSIAALRQTSFNVCPILFDYCIMINDKDTAALIIDDFESYLNGEYRDQYVHQVRLYDIRKKTYENWA